MAVAAQTQMDRDIICNRIYVKGKAKGSPYSITERRVQELVPLSPKRSSRLPLLSARPAVTLATLKRAATNFAVS